MKNEKEQTDCYLFAPKMKKFFKTKRKNEALLWIPVETSLLFCDEFQNIAPINRCIFVSFMLLCGIRGELEIPFRINYLANTLGINKRAISKGIDELISAKLLHKTDRQTEKTERTAQTDRQETSDEGAVCVDSKNSFQDNSDEIQDSKFKIQDEQSKNNLKSEILNLKSQFSIAECLKYVEICKSKGDAIKSTKALANHLFKTGEADAFILATLYPEKLAEIDRETYGEPRQFTDEPCTVCYGAKMAEMIKGSGFAKCPHCQNEKGKATGFEPNSKPF